MVKPEYRVIEGSDVGRFVKELNEAAEDDFLVISSNKFVLKYDSTILSDISFEILYYALIVKNPVQTSNDFQYKILDELNEIKFELKEVVNNLKYLGE